MERAHILFLFLLVTTTACIPKGSMAARYHVVGSSFGWQIPNTTTYYQEWAQTKNIVVGDNLVFLYTTGLHNVLEVSAEDYENCTMKKVVDMLYRGPTILNMTEAGPHYYYCGVGTHCEAGQKLAINVSATAPPETDEAPAPPPLEDADKSAAGSIPLALPFASVLIYLFQYSLLL